MIKHNQIDDHSIDRVNKDREEKKKSQRGVIEGHPDRSPFWNRCGSPTSVVPEESGVHFFLALSSFSVENLSSLCFFKQLEFMKPATIYDLYPLHLMLQRYFSSESIHATNTNLSYPSVY
jgi:hypothetical protein